MERNVDSNMNGSAGFYGSHILQSTMERSALLFPVTVCEAHRDGSLCEQNGSTHDVTYGFKDNGY